MGIEGLALAWFTNLDNIQDNMKLFLGFLKHWSVSVKDLLSGVGDMIFGILGGDITRFSSGIAKIIAGGMNEAFLNDFVLTKPGSGGGGGAGEIETNAEKLGERIAIAFKGGLRKHSKNKAYGGGKDEPFLFVELIGTKEAISDKIEHTLSAFEEFYGALMDIGDVARTSFGIISNGMDALSGRLAQVMFNTRRKFKDIWIGMAQDFLQYFFSIVIKRLALLAVSSFLPGGGAAIGTVLPIGGGGSITNAGLGQLKTTNQLLSGISTQLANQPPIVISSERLYRAVVHEQQRVNVRRGMDVNGLVFSS